MKMKKSTTRSHRNSSEAAYSHLGPRIDRTLGTTRDGSEVVSPSNSNVRTLESAIPAASVRSVEVYDHYDEKRGKAVYKDVKLDVMANARQTAFMGRGQKLRSVTGAESGNRKREEFSGCCTPSVPSVGGPLSGDIKRRY